MLQTGRKSSHNPPTSVWAGLIALAVFTVLGCLRLTHGKPGLISLAATDPVGASSQGSQEPTLLNARVDSGLSPAVRTPVHSDRRRPPESPPNAATWLDSFLEMAPQDLSRVYGWADEIDLIKDQLNEEQVLLLGKRLVRELRDDDVPWNAGYALSALASLDPPSHPALYRMLLDTLKSTDLQQRSLVADLLRKAGPGAADELLGAAAIELGDDDIPSGDLPVTLRNASQSARMLIREGSRSWPHLTRRLHASDPQERFLSAVVLARTHCPEKLDLTVTVLVSHLKHNDWKGDAIIAGRALHELGDLALPQLRRLQGIADDQGRRLVRLALSEIEQPSTTDGEAYKRAQRIASDGAGEPLAVWRFTPDTLDGLVRRFR